MIKVNRNIWFWAALMAVSIISCKDDNTEVSTITSFEKFTITQLPQNRVVPEADETYTITFGFDDKQIMDVHVELAPSEASTATEGVDYDLSTHEVAVAGLEGTGSFDITVHSDFEAEGDETVVIHFQGVDPHGLPTPVEALVLTIRDSIYPAAVRVDWQGTFEYAGDTYTICDNVDIDLFLVDDQGEFAGGFGGATGSCPETMFLGGLADGVYDIVVNLYDNALFGTPDIDTVPIPLTVSLFKGGVVSDVETTIHFSTDDFGQVTLWTAYTESDPDGNFLVVVGRIRVSGGKVTLIDPNGNDVGTLDQ